MGYGLYRFLDDCLGECARIRSSTGDAAPYLSKRVYELLGCTPPFDELPARSEIGPVHLQFRVRMPVRPRIESAGAAIP